jgi:hypothetical protein
MVEYGLLVAGIALMTSAATSLLGHKATDLVSMVAAVLPGAHGDDNGPLLAGQLIEVEAPAGGGPISLDVATIVGGAGTARLETNLGLPGLGGLIVQP